MEASMKKFYIGERFFSIGDSFDIFDEGNNPVYRVKEKLLTLGKQYSLFNHKGQKLGFVKQKLFRFLPQYEIYLNDRLAAIIKKRFSFFVKKFDIESESGNYKLDGDLLAWNFKILKDNQVFCQVHKNFTIFKDRYEILVSEGFDEVFSLCLVIVLDAVFHDKKHRR